MRDYQSIYSEATVQINSLSEGLIEQNKLDIFNKDIKEKLENFNPSIMLYGVYNSGKSSLINALYGEAEKASTGDRPLTADIQGYQWNGYTIWDTPGIDAPIEHEKITQEHLKKTEIVLFLLSNDGVFEEKYIYEKIADIIFLGKPISIILNNKKGIDPESEDFYKDINKVNKNLIKIADAKGIKNIEQKVDVIYVNTKSALKAKLEGKNLLLKKSNIQTVADTIDKLLLESDTGNIVNTLNQYITSFIDNIIEKIDNQTDDIALSEIQSLLTYLEKNKQTSFLSLKNRCYKDIQNIGNDISGFILEKKEQTDINKMVEVKLEVMNQKVNIEITKLIANLETKFEKVNTVILNNLENSGIEMDEYSEDDEFTMPNEAKVGMKKMGEAALDGLKDQKAVAEGLKDGMMQLRKMKVPGFKGKWEKGFEKVAGENAKFIGKVVGPAIRVFAVAWEVYGSIRDHNKYMEEKRNFVQAANNSANKWVDEQKSNITALLEEEFSELYDPLIKALQDNLKGESEQLNNIVTKKEKLSDVKVAYL